MRAVCQVCDHGPGPPPRLRGVETRRRLIGGMIGVYVENTKRRRGSPYAPPGVTATPVQTWRAARPTRKRDRRL